MLSLILSDITRFKFIGCQNFVELLHWSKYTLRHNSALLFGSITSHESIVRYQLVDALNLKSCISHTIRIYLTKSVDYILVIEVHFKLHVYLGCGILPFVNKEYPVYFT
uniref:Uncharacterized protein n=1 Tax=Herelleviridae sp. cttEB8 TaxID=2825832 RepID=A0A8S5P7F7_9CAUD|nr:MAG TPA: hypothetical protein [Herelleviridae sp. cttEB8]